MHRPHPVIDERLRRTLELCARAHPHYRTSWADHGIDPAGVRSVADLPRLPLTTKADLMAAPERFVLEADKLQDLPLEERTLWNVAYTTGTTSGRPSAFYNTTHDQFHLMRQARTCNLVEGLHQDDVIANLYPLAPLPLGAFLTCVRSGEALGVPIVSTLTGSHNPDYPVRRSLDEAIDILERSGTSVLWGVPSFVRRLLRRTAERAVRLPRARMVITSGEPVDEELQAEFIDHLRRFGAEDPQIRARYACTELQGGLVQCSNGSALHHVTPELYHFEVVDPDSGDPVPIGSEGMIALTHLHRRGTVLLRYLIGDVIGLAHDRCPACGFEGIVVTHPPHRVGELVKVKGMLVNPRIIGEALTADRSVQEYQIAVRTIDEGEGRGQDELVIRVEADASDHERLARTIPGQVRGAVLVSPRVELLEGGALHDPEADVKARRFVDERVAR